MAAGRFRADLLFRLRVFEIAVPPLRQRVADLPLLVARLLDRLGRPGEQRPALSAAAWDALMHYPFPGNVRELENTLTHALVMSRGQPEILPRHLPAEVAEHAKAMRYARTGRAQFPVRGGGAVRAGVHPAGAGDDRRREEKGRADPGDLSSVPVPEDRRSLMGTVIGPGAVHPGASFRAVAALKLLIGNKNYSTWSMRPWLVLKQADIPFVEEKLSFNDPQLKQKIRQVSPSGRVPALVDGDLVVWDSLAIVEYLAEKFPDKKLWPQEARARAVARSMCAEMHAGFAVLRAALVMNFEADLPGRGWNVKVQAEIDRLVEMWQDARARFGAGGPFLFGSFTIADAFFAPVVRRFLGYAIPLPPVAAAYAQAVAALPAYQEWAAGGQSGERLLRGGRTLSIEFGDPQRVPEPPATDSAGQSPAPSTRISRT